MVHISDIICSGNVNLYKVAGKSEQQGHVWGLYPSPPI